MPHNRPKRGCLGLFYQPIRVAPWWLYHSPAYDNRDDESWHTCDNKSPAPADPFVDPAADQVTEHNAEINAETKNGHGGGPFFGFIQVGDNRMGGRIGTGFADADANSG